MGMFDGKVALITGSAQGIGQAIALKFAENGADVVVHGIGATADCKTCKDIEALGRKTLVYDTDITDVKAVNAMVDDVIAKWGKIDILVNNAGIYPAVLCVDVDEAHFDKVVDVNLKGTFFTTQAVVKKSMIPNNYGRIVSISSCDGKCPASGVAIYSAAKAGVISLVKSFALEMAEYDINSNCVAPGWVESETVLAGDRWKDALKIIPSRRLGKLSEIGEACCFLCNDNVSYINGEVLDVNGAIIMD
ncbi:SDR family NAD(P)-dependent oxidoreductase [Bacilliculturomica massiliensis]|uniref:SDR family NAD(P)-dependent oxidoreductase n=1 Tax=Bacilliculturomica massiliensis TaxID=1917867 RepID=UPI001031F9A8|nr:SDR family NAD(P)-dependent oxidoreductase [Bacilliculturomica massiliensis]